MYESITEEFFSIFLIIESILLHFANYEFLIENSEVKSFILLEQKF